MTVEEIKKLFGEGIDCSQVVAENFSEKLNMDSKTLRKMASAFGGGISCGETCGAITGGLMVLGLKYGNYIENDFDQKTIIQEKSNEFRSKFLSKYPSCICKELLGYNISDPSDLEKILEKGLLENYCPYIVKDSIEILDELIK